MGILEIMLELLRVGGLVALGYGIEDDLGWQEFEQAHATLAARGEVLDLAAHFPEPVDPAQNFGSAPILQEALKRGYDEPWDDLVKQLGDRIHAESLTEEQACELAEFMPEIRALRAQLADYLQFPESSWNATFDPEEELMEYPPLKAGDMGLVRLILLHARWQAFFGNQSDGIVDVQIVQRLIELHQGEPFIIPHIVQAAETTLLLYWVEETLLEGQWLLGELEIIDAWLAKQDPHQQLQRHFQAFAACLFHHGSKLVDRKKAWELLRHTRGWYRLAPRGWAWRGGADLALEVHPYIQKLEDREPLGEIAELLEKRMRELEEGIRMRSWTLADEAMVPRMLAGVSLDQARKIALLRAVIAVERHRIMTGRLPDVAHALPWWPTDPLDDGPVYYELQGNGYQIDLLEVGVAPNLNPRDFTDLTFVYKAAEAGQ